MRRCSAIPQRSGPPFIHRDPTTRAKVGEARKLISRALAAIDEAPQEARDRLGIISLRARDFLIEALARDPAYGDQNVALSISSDSVESDVVVNLPMDVAPSMAIDRPEVSDASIVATIRELLVIAKNVLAVPHVDLGHLGFSAKPDQLALHDGIAALDSAAAGALAAARTGGWEPSAVALLPSHPLHGPCCIAVRSGHLALRPRSDDLVMPVSASFLPAAPHATMISRQESIDSSGGRDRTTTTITINRTAGYADLSTLPTHPVELARLIRACPLDEALLEALRSGPKP